MSVKIVNEISPKLEQFIRDLNSLMDKYQYDMTALLEYQTNGIFPVLRMIDMPPKEDEKEPETSETSTTAPTEVEPTPTDNLDLNDGGTPSGS